MRILRPRYIILVNLALLITTSGAVYAQTKEVKSVPMHATNSIKGDDLFREFCAVCHGTDAKGNGPAAEALKTRPADLTMITRHGNTNKFPALQVMRIVNGEDVVAAHGTHDMPTWGAAFSSVGSPEAAKLRVNALVDYLQKIQN
jgi:mono/diheme cytochrome c family protein